MKGNHQRRSLWLQATGLHMCREFLPTVTFPPMDWLIWMNSHRPTPRRSLLVDYLLILMKVFHLINYNFRKGSFLLVRNYLSLPLSLHLYVCTCSIISIYIYSIMTYHPFFCTSPLDDIMAFFGQFGVVYVDWPYKRQNKGTIPPKGTRLHFISATIVRPVNLLYQNLGHLVQIQSSSSARVNMTCFA